MEMIIPAFRKKYSMSYYMYCAYYDTDSNQSVSIVRESICIVFNAIQMETRIIFYSLNRCKDPNSIWGIFFLRVLFTEKYTVLKNSWGAVPNR